MSNLCSVCGESVSKKAYYDKKRDEWVCPFCVSTYKETYQDEDESIERKPITGFHIGNVFEGFDLSSLDDDKMN